MIKSILNNAAIYTAVNIFSRGISFFLLPLYTSVLSPSDYGILDLILISGYFINLSIALEVSQAVARFYPSEESETIRTEIASTAFWFSLCIYILFASIFLLLSDQIALLLFQEGDHELFFRIGVVYIFFNGLFMFVQNQFRWQMRTRAYAIVSIFFTICTAGISVLLAYVLNFGLSGLLIGLGSGAALGFVLGITKLKDSIKRKFDRALLKKMLAFSIPLVPASIAVFVSNYFDRLMINHFLTLKEVGLYGTAFRIASIVSFVIKGVSGAFTPFVFKNYKDIKTPLLISQVFRYFLGVILIVFTLLSSFSLEITRVLTSESFYESHELIIVLVPSIILTYMYLFTPGMSLAKRTGLILSVSVVGAIINIGLNFVLIPMFGIRGAALATLISYFIVFLLNMYFSQRFYFVPHRWLPLISSTIIMTVIAYVGSLFPSETVSFAFLKGLLIFILTFFVFMLCRVIRFSELLKLKEKLLKMLQR